MITITLTNRDRELRIVKKSLDSLASQSTKDFKVFLVDYGSELAYVKKLKELVSQYFFAELIICAVNGQLWNKARAINIALKQTSTPYFLVGDIDLIFHPNFIKKAEELASNNQVHYFQYGFLSKEESLKEQSFEQYNVDFKGNEEVTGTTLFPTLAIKDLNGYDEFYHGWGAEDTDIHIRMANAGFSVSFYDDEIMLKHQWHPKAYRSKKSHNPFHSKLEKINHSYMQFTSSSKRTKINLKQEWGKLPAESNYKKLTEPVDYQFTIFPADTAIAAILMQLKNFQNCSIQIDVYDISFKEKIKQQLKKNFGKKYKNYLSMQTVNNLFLEEIVSNYGNLSYRYFFENEKGKIQLLMQF